MLCRTLCETTLLRDYVSRPVLLGLPLAAASDRPVGGGRDSLRPTHAKHWSGNQRLLLLKSVICRPGKCAASTRLKFGLSPTDRRCPKMVYRGGCISTAEEICSPFAYDACIGVDLTLCIEGRSESVGAFRGSGPLG